eukprot:gb/GECG01007770.1/.p1 GENE.gb/GECG01007770.1/~~gb/GECG01007770.1/.p1  ORF type:complete len:101 (+),score=12.03 gb/GECG01007770.1/:1-303(+)
MSAVLQSKKGEQLMPEEGDHPSPSWVNSTAAHHYAEQKARPTKEGYRNHTLRKQTFTVRNRYVDLKLTGKGSYGFVALARDLVRLRASSGGTAILSRKLF